MVRVTASQLEHMTYSLVKVTPQTLKMIFTDTPLWGSATKVVRRMTYEAVFCSVMIQQNAMGLNGMRT